MPTFTPPTVDEGIECSSRLIGRFKLARGISIVKTSGHYAEQRFPWQGDLEPLAEGSDYFIGGHVYTIDSATASALTIDGFGAYIT